ncbi:MAG TPA: AsmA family protein, partial [Chromatiaceae bacterium]|nr:AsmA family protein [Chromatiaceae bacterium]
MPKPSRYALLSIPLGGTLFLALSLARLDLEAGWADLRAQVLAETGLELTSTGGPELSLFPSPGVSLAEVSVGEAAAVGEPWLRCARVGVYPRLAPLLLGRMELDLIRLDGVHLDLTRAGPGRRQPRAGTSDSALGAAQAPAGQAAPRLRGARIQVVGGAVIWGTAGLSELGLDAGPVAIEG